MMTNKNTTPVEEPGARVLVEPLPQVLDEMERHIRSAEEAAKRAQEAAKMSRESASEATIASEESHKAGEKAAAKATKAAGEGAAKAERVARVATEAAEQAMKTAGEAVAEAEKAHEGARQATVTAEAAKRAQEGSLGGPVKGGGDTSESGHQETHPMGVDSYPSNYQPGHRLCRRIVCRRPRTSRLIPGPIGY